jgi:hypothetical protein
MQERNVALLITIGTLLFFAGWVPLLTFLADLHKRWTAIDRSESLSDADIVDASAYSKS